MASTAGKNGLYICLVSVHGLIRGENLELGRDADTGGQTLYVVELARALARRPEVERVDLFTRRVIDPRIDDDYAQPEEELGDNAHIIRIDAGPDEYLPKERLWDYLNCFVDGALAHIDSVGRTPTLVHSHYADAGYVGVRLASNLGVPLVHTGHSLGRVKRRRLLARGESSATIENTYAMSTRVRAEEEVLLAADMVVVSTGQEIEEQYGLYDWADEDKMTVIPPGVNLERFNPPPATFDPPMRAELKRFLKEPERPLVLALSRPDERKNIATLIEAFGGHPQLREQANLVIIAGNRDDIRDMDAGPRKVLTDLLLLIDYYDLYGVAAYPRHHVSDDVPDLYRLVTRSGGVFINPALTEPFGLTLIEAAATGAPILATEDGGPRDIIGACENGELIDPLDAESMGQKIHALLDDRDRWRRYSDNGVRRVREHYSWDAHVESYLERIAGIATGERHPERPTLPDHVLTQVDRAIVVELATLGDSTDAATRARLVETLRQRRRWVGFGVVSDCPRHEVLAQLKEMGVPTPDVLITRGGTQIHYGPRLSRDEGWSRHIGYAWQPDRVYNLLTQTPGLALRSRAVQGVHAVHAFIEDADAFPGIEALENELHGLDIHAHLVSLSRNEVLAMPVRASKGFALRYFASQWGIPLDRLLVVGGCATDEDMLRGNPLGAVVTADGKKELPGLTDLDRVIFTRKHGPAGVLEAIDYYDFFDACALPGDREGAR
ncbi:glycosyltransferase [Guyparkeria hydrothermalis]|uniref:HAD family hydrolase n=1 Tax=Guyparkeria hydrothermalis TaxID=923 RepID=UPI0020219DA9|nr:HAD family hydrolase [Guyparkeria hydrothermalis]MCL7745149.1 glycosyltransferase [Guyparkeria hydrothermalis]